MEPPFEHAIPDLSAAYTPIEAGREFRVLKLKPAPQFSDGIECELKHADLKDPPPFEALSYVWGDLRYNAFCQLEQWGRLQLSPEIVYEILNGKAEGLPGYEAYELVETFATIGGQKVSITANLDDALRFLRYTDQERTLWVDALCIAQHDLDERSKHVGSMKDVYAACTRDLLWIGPDDALIDDARRLLSGLGTILDAVEKSWSDRDSLKPVAALFSKPRLWERVWIMQEVSFAPTVLLVAGHATMPWEEVEGFLDTDRYIRIYGVPDAYHTPMAHGSGIHGHFGKAITYPHILAHQRRTLSGKSQGYGASLMDVLARFRHTHATDDRDKIYGLLGLCSDTLGIEPDYHITAREVYIDCSRRLIERDDNLDLLCQGPWELGGNYHRNPDLPSWCPDYAHAGESRILFAQRDIYAAGPRSLGGKLPLSPRGILKLDGHAVCTLAIVRDENDAKYVSGPPFSRGPKVALAWMPNVLLREAIQQGNICLTKFLKDEDEPIGSMVTQSRFEDYWRTLMVDSRRKPWRRLQNNDLEDLRGRFHRWRADVASRSDIQLRRRPVGHRCGTGTDTGELDFDPEGDLSAWYEGWRFAISAQGLYCMVPPAAEEADHIVVLPGAKVPILLRPRDENALEYLWVGACYVHGLMNGEALKPATFGVAQRSFHIV